MKVFFRKSLIAVFSVSFVSFSFLKAEEDVVELGAGVGNFLAKIESGKSIHVAFLGGSITQNNKGHSAMVPEQLKAKFPDTEFTFTNAGLSSTCSMSGAFRLKRDVLSKGPIDLLVVEFAVNDDQDAGHDRDTAIRGLEGIVRQFYTANPSGDIISVQYVNPPILEKITNGEKPVSVTAHKDVARHYQIPTVDIGMALANDIAVGLLTWKEDYGGTHPNQKGYAFASDWIMRVIEDSKPNEAVADKAVPSALNENSFAAVAEVDPQQMAWLGGWQFAPVSKELLPVGGIRDDYKKFQALRSDSPGDMFYYTFSGKSLGAFILAGPDSGTLEISVDGGEWNEVTLFHHYSKSLNYPRSVMLADGLTSGYHQVAVKVGKKTPEGSKGNSATILQFQISQ